MARAVDLKAAAGKAPKPETSTDVLVVGAGVAGCAAAIEAAQGGARVMLVDENPLDPGLMGMDVPLFFGGRHGRATANPGRMMERVIAARPALEAAMEAGVEVRLGVSVWGAFVPGYGLASLPGPLAGLADHERSWMVGFEKIILATGARDVALAFPGWDQPGVMGAAAFRTLIETYDAFAGRRLAILGSGELASATLALARRRGLEVAEIPPDHIPCGARGGIDGIEALIVRPLAGGAELEIACDTVVEAVSLTPVIELLDVLGGAIALAPDLGGFAPVSIDGVSTSLAQVFVAGEAAGAPAGSWLSDAEAEASGRRAAARALGRPIAPLPPRSDLADAVADQQAWVRALAVLEAPETILCQCETMSLGDLLGVRQPRYLGAPPAAMAGRNLERLLQDGPASPDQIKRLTRAMMGPCQGRRCREQCALALAGASNTPPERVALAGYRAPVRPLPLKVLADWTEEPALSRHWDVWFGIPSQWVPDRHIGTDEEALYAGILGEEPT
jgi:NADPH-dependent 2,4-dienoyl-CoA reductase/sulfur reductase-like enzyme